MHSSFFPCIRAWLEVLLVLAICTFFPAQESQIVAIADQVAGSLSHSKQKTIVILDFVGPGEIAVLGQKLAADFREALIKSAHDFRVEDRSQLLELLQKNDLLPGSIRDRETADWYLRNSGADAAILGTLSNGSGGVKLSLQAFSLRESELFSGLETSIPLTYDLKGLLGQHEKDEFASLPKADENGYISPACIYCPIPPFTAEASRRKFAGTVVMQITIDENGHARDIRVESALPYGLTEQATEAVREWRFKPSTGPNGKPAAVRTRIQTTFHLY
jgi:TonB family protein